MEDTIVANSVLKRAETTKSTEAQIKAASDSILKIETDIKSRQDIEIVLATLRSAEDKAKLALLRPMKVLNESLKMAKETLNTVENKQIDEHKRLRAVEEWVKATVDDTLWNVFRDTRTAHKDDRHDQVVKGIDAIKKRLIVAPVSVMNAISEGLTPLKEKWAVTKQLAMKKMLAINAVERRSRETATLLGTNEGIVTDNDAKQTAMRGIKSVPGEGNVSQKVQDLLDAGNDSAVTWDAFFKSVMKLLEDTSVRDELEGKKEIEEEGKTYSFVATGGGAGAMVQSVAFQAAVKDAVDEQMKSLTLGGSHQQPQATALHASGGPQQGGQYQPQAPSQPQFIFVPPQWSQQHQQNGGGGFQAYAATAGAWGQGGGGGRGGGGRVGGGRGGGGRGGGGRGGGGRNICFAYNRGHCDRGDECRFRHEASGGNAGAAAGGTAGQGQPAKTAKGPCNYGAACNHKDSCPFDHPKDKGSNQRSGTPTANAGEKRKQA